MRIQELENPAQLRVLEPMIHEYFRIVSDGLAELGISLAPEEAVADMMASLDQYIPPLGRAYAVELDGSIQGMGFLKPLGADAVELKRLYLRAKLRGSGAGRELLKHILYSARELGFATIYLDTIAPLKAAIGLYEAEGFKEVPAYSGSEIAKDAKIRPHGIYMAKEL